MQALCTLQPYSKQKLKPQDIMTFPWEKEDGKMERWKDGKMERWKDGKMEEWKDEKTEAPSEVSREEIMERYRKARERRGIS